MMNSLSSKKTFSGIASIIEAVNSGMVSPINNGLSVSVSFSLGDDDKKEDAARLNKINARRKKAGFPDRKTPEQRRAERVQAARRRDNQRKAARRRRLEPFRQKQTERELNKFFGSIDESASEYYSGNCPIPSATAADGSRCGLRAASVR